MRARSTARLVSLAALVPLLALAVSGSGYDRFRCVFSGLVSEDGCCPAEEAPATPVVNGASCCDHESARPVKVAAEAAAPSLVAALTFAPLSHVALSALPERASPAPRAAAQAPPPTPLRVLKQSFLI